MLGLFSVLFPLSNRVYGTIPESYTNWSNYYDFNGDGVFEHNGAYRYIKNSKGEWILNSSSKTSVERLYGLGNDGYLYGYIFNTTLYDGKLVRFRGFNGIAETVKEIPIPTRMDYDLDGKSEFIYHDSSKNKYFVIAPSADGTVMESGLTTMTPAEYAGVRSELQLSTGGEGIPGMGDMIGRDGGGSGLLSDVSVADINSDGLPDFINNANGNFFLNTGDGSFVESNLGERVCFRDFNGDGINDLLLWENSTGTVRLYDKANLSTEPLVLLNGPRLHYLYVRDIDADGDLDVIGLVDGYYYSNDSYVLISENQGNRKFRLHEHYIENSTRSYNFTSFCDLDADGKYEILGRQSSEHFIIKIETPASVSVQRIESYSGYNDLYALRADSSGEWFITDSERQPTFYKTFPANSRPAKPEKPTLVYDAGTGRLTVSWPLGTDKETAPLDLTYEVRIGTAPGSSDIVAAQALENGTRRNLKPGLCGYSTYTVYKTDSWPEGNIYISYQVIDDGFMGSEFSEPAIFEKKKPASDFRFSCSESQDFAVGIDIEAYPAFVPVPTTRYQWNFSDGKIISLDKTTQKAVVRFDRPGYKNISLSSTSASGINSVTQKSFLISPLSSYKDGSSFSGTVDVDGDGCAELLYGSQLYAENAEGKYETIKKSFNTSSDIRSAIFPDVNKDGFADAIGRGNLYFGTADGSMLKTPKTLPSTEWLPYDFNNDGYVDESYSLLNAGDYVGCYPTEVHLTPPRATFGFYPARIYYYDFNGDGLIDIGSIAAVSDVLFSDRLPFHIYENIDGQNYKEGYEISKITQEPALIDDIDGDGKADFVMCDASYNFGVTSYAEYVVIIWGSGAADTKLQCPDGKPFQAVTGVFDFNNDGMKDIAVKIQNNENGVLTLFPDKTYTYTSTGPFPVYNGIARRRDGNIKFSGTTLTATENERPAPPTAIRSIQNDNAVVIEWNAGKDKETPEKGLRYNISIKHKGAEGENAYFISPCNGGSDVCALPSSLQLLTSAKFTIPINSIPPGEYEVCLQTVDWQNVASVFSQVYDMTVQESAVISLPASGMIGKSVDVTIATNISSSIDFGSDATIIAENGSSKTVVWSSEGLKEIKINGKTVAGIFIYPIPDASFTLPTTVLSGARVDISGTNLVAGTWEISEDNNEFAPLPVEGVAEIVLKDNKSLAIRFLSDNKTVTVRHTLTEEYGTDSYEQSTNIIPGSPAIDLVTVDDNSHFNIKWDIASVPEDVSDIRIYKEGAKYNMYELLDEVSATTGEYTDIDSDASVKSCRYKISYVLPYGESGLSAAHQPSHVRINKAAGNAINLSWSRYEGAEVESYRIFKGSSQDNLQMLDILSGHMLSFIDEAANACESYYCIEVIADTNSSVDKIKSRLNSRLSRSNVVRGVDAQSIVLAKEILVGTMEGRKSFDAHPTLSLQARMLPTNASVSKVRWELVNGENIISLDNYGNAIAKAIGKATVRAYAIDGSGVYGDIEVDNNRVPVTLLDIKKYPDNHTLRVGESFRYILKVEPVVNNDIIVWESSNPDVATVTQDGVVTAIRPGQSEIHVKSSFAPDKWFTMLLTVSRPEGYIEVEDIATSNYGQLNGVPGDEFDVDIVFYPEDATDKSLKWCLEPENTPVATVSQSGHVTIMQEGTAKLWVQSISNPYARIVIDIFGISSVEDIFTNDSVRYDVYNITGYCVLRDASQEDIHRLQSGFYIANGKKFHIGIR